jgi:hypothetical protein
VEVYLPVSPFTLDDNPNTTTTTITTTTTTNHHHYPAPLPHRPFFFL